MTFQFPHITQDRLWRFCLEYYNTPGVKELCLTVQNKYAGNVNLLLISKWLDNQNINFDSCHWIQIFNCLKKTEELLINFRKLRHDNKLYIPQSLYQSHLNFELKLERQQQSDLINLINQLPLYQTSTPTLLQRYCKNIKVKHLYSYFPD